MGLDLRSDIQMLFYNYRLYSLFLLNTVWVQSKETIIIKTSDESKENAFVDVLKNITSANQILQELIKNYEQLQNIYKTSDEKSYSDDSGNDKNNIFKALSSRESEDKEYTTKASYGGSYGITQMILADETVENTEEQSFGSTGNASNIIHVENSKMKERKPNISKELKEVSSSEYQDEIEIVTQKTKNKLLEKEKKKMLNPIKLTQTEKPKTRFSIQNKANKDAKRHFNKVRPSLRQRSGDKTIQRIVYAEVFSPDKIWHEVIHKPIKLKVYDEDINFRKAKEKKTENKTPETITEEKEFSEAISDSKPDDDLIEQEEMKSLILRNAYGDACLQVTVRKCYKALKAVSKAVCRMRFKCKSSLKGSFKENAKKGCIREFVNGKKKPGKEEEIVFERTINKNGGTEVSKYVDLCLPHLRSERSNKTDNIRNGSKEFKTINTLRDRFETACKKLSAKKCIKACKFATEAACSIHGCQNSKKKAFKKSCKSECKAAYNLYGGASSDDDDESESNSD